MQNQQSLPRRLTKGRACACFSVFTGGLRSNPWLMLDTALLTQSMGVTGLVLVLDEARYRRCAFKAAIVPCLWGLLDRGITVRISSPVGWTK